MPQISDLSAAFIKAALADRVRLEFDYPTGKVAVRVAFIQQYQSLSGETPPDHPSYLRASNKFGRQFRLYLSLDGPQRHFVETALRVTLTSVAIQHGHRSYNYRFTPRSANPQLFWDLVALGFRLGDN